MQLLTERMGRQAKPRSGMLWLTAGRCRKSQEGGGGEGGRVAGNRASHSIYRPFRARPGAEPYN